MDLYYKSYWNTFIKVFRPSAMEETSSAHLYHLSFNSKNHFCPTPDCDVKKSLLIKMDQVIDPGSLKELLLYLVYK